MSNRVIVETRQELKKAMDKKVDTIEIQGKLAKDVHKTRIIKTVSPVALAGLVAAVTISKTNMPIQGGIRLLNKLPITQENDNGMIVVAMTAIITIGISVVIALWKDYEEIGFDMSKGKCIIRKKQLSNS